MQAIVRSPVGGDVLTDCLLKSLENKSISVSAVLTEAYGRSDEVVADLTVMPCGCR